MTLLGFRKGMSQKLEFSKDPAIDVWPELSLSSEHLLQCPGSLARPGLTTMGDPEDDDEEEEEEKKKKEENEEEEGNDGENDEEPWQVVLPGHPHLVTRFPTASL